MSKKKENKTVEEILQKGKPHADQDQNAHEHSKKHDEDEFVELQKKIDELSDTILRMRADNENLRKRQDRDLEKAVNFANSNFATDLMEVMENFHRALENVPKAEEKDDALSSFLKGIELTKAALEDVFSRHGIVRIYPLGKMFDHDLHQAVKQEKHNEHEVGVVIGVMQSGYTLKGRVLRPAMVIVAS